MRLEHWKILNEALEKHAVQISFKDGRPNLIAIPVSAWKETARFSVANPLEGGCRGFHKKEVRSVRLLNVYDLVYEIHNLSERVEILEN